MKGIAMKMEHRHSFKARALALLLTLAMVIALLPVFASLAADEPDYEENPESLTFENGNLARENGVLVSSQYGSHEDAQYGWSLNYINDGSMNTAGDGISNGGYHTNGNEQDQYAHPLWSYNHSEWVGYEFPDSRTFDTVVVYPSKDQDGICYGMPNAFAIEVSVDGESYLRVFETYDYAIPAFGPQTFQFEAITAKYVRFVALSVNRDGKDHAWRMKICEMAVYNKGYADTEPYSPNLAVDKPVTCSPNHVDGPWQTAYINDGDRYNMAVTAFDWGQFAGWHTAPSDTASDAWIVIDLGEATYLDKAVIWPATERYKHSRNSVEDAWTDNLALPNTMKLEISDNGEDWTEVAALSEMPTEWGPIEFTFDRTETRYVRLYMTRSSHVKLSEFEIYDTTNKVTPEPPVEEEAVYTPGVNLALGETPFASAALENGTWTAVKLNNGEIEADGGFSTPVGGTPPMYCGIAFEHLTAVNRVVLYSASTNTDEGVWSGIPRSFKIQYSTDNLNWYDAAAKTCEEPVSGQNALTVTFETVEAKYIRIWTDDPWPKVSDADRVYIQLAEMEVWYDDSTTLSSEDAFSAYYQVREGDSEHDLRVLLVANVNKLPRVESVTVKVVFDLVGGGTKTITGVLGGESSNYTLYRQVTAAGAVYTAAEGCAIFGHVVTGIPDGAYSNVTVTITETDTSRVLLSASMQ